MNCKHVEELLPLYVGRDLEEKRAKLVTAHVQSCTQCARSAEEYRQAQQLLPLFEPPPFSEAIYAGIRGRVLREIGRESTAPTPLQQFAQMVLQPRIRWAASFALLIAVCVGAFYLLTQRTKDQRPVPQIAGSHEVVDQTIRDNDVDARPHDNGEAASLSPSSKEGAGPSTIRPERRKGGSTNRTRPARMNATDAPSMTAQVLPKSNKPAEPDASSAPASATSEKTLRMEIQTSDRNVRIIWFSQQRTKQDSSSESSKGL